VVASIAITHYDVLGVDATSTADQLRHAYRTAVKAAHPDTGGTPEAFARVQQAWEQLRDPQRRAAYDREIGADRPAPTAPTAAPPAQSGAPGPVGRYVAASAGRGRHGLVACLAIATAMTGSVTAWGVGQLGRPGVMAAGVFLALSLGSLAARATGLDVGRGTYRLTQRAAWALAGLLAAIAGAFWTLERGHVIVPATGAACVALYAAAVALLWRQLQRRA
jgi:hypothetical protein